MSSRSSPVIQTLHRITLEYVDREDRVRATGALEGDAPVVIWLSQRLLQRLVPALVAWLEEQEGPHAGGARQRFAQEAAQAALAPQDPVRGEADSVAWLAEAVDITRSAHALTLALRGTAAGEAAGFTLDARALRQWLGMLHEIYLKADWPLSVWPAWVVDAPRGEQPVVLH